MVVIVMRLEKDLSPLQVCLWLVNINTYIVITLKAPGYFYHFRYSRQSATFIILLSLVEWYELHPNDAIEPQSHGSQYFHLL